MISIILLIICALETKQDEVEKVVADDELACKKCENMSNPEWILLCDECNAGWHTTCLNPPLTSIPQGDWFCPNCQHVSILNFSGSNIISRC